MRRLLPLAALAALAGCSLITSFEPVPRDDGSVDGDADTDVDVDGDADAVTDADEVADADADAVADADTTSDADAVTDADTVTDADADDVIDADATADADTTSDADAVTDADVTSDADVPACGVALRRMSWLTDAAPRSLDMADIDGDGRADAVVAMDLPPSSGLPDELTIYLNIERSGARAIGSGRSFTFSPEVAVGGSAFGNVDSDAALEVLSFVSRSDSPPGQIRILNDPLGTVSVVTVDASRGLTGGVVADLDGDIFVDAVATAWDPATPEGHLVYWVRTAVGFPAEQELSLGAAEPGRLVAADLTGDGVDEIVVAFPTSFALRVYRLNASSELVEAATLTLPHSPVDVRPVDLDDDGQPELLVSSGADGLWLVETSPGPGLGAATAIDASVLANAADAGDLDGDGDQDVAVIGASEVNVYCNDGSGALSPLGALTAYSSATPAFLRVAAITDDSRLDVTISQVGQQTLLSE